MRELIKNQVYELRTKSGITQEALAEAVGVTRQTIIVIEKGNCAPSVILALKIAKFFKKSLESVFQRASRRRDSSRASRGKRDSGIAVCCQNFSVAT